MAKKREGSRRRKSWRAANRGTAFKTTPSGGLFLEFQPWRVLALRPSPPMAWEKRKSSGRWYGRREAELDVAALLRDVRQEELILEGLPRESLLVDERPNNAPFFARRRRNFRAFLEDVPVSVQDVIADGWVGETWPLLRLLCRSPEALDLYHSGAPHLSWALSMAHALPDAPKDTVAFARRWSRRSRKRVMARLGFEAPRSAARILERVPRHHLDKELLFQLRSALTEACGRKLLAHAQRPTLGLVLVARGDLHPHIAPSLHRELEELDDPDAGWAFVRELRHTLRQAEELQLRGRPRFSSLAHLRLVHDELSERARLTLGTRGWDTTPLPPAPAELTPDEERLACPLTTGAELVAEGIEMRHCLGTLEQHHILARRGRFYAWRVAGPERGTLALVRTGDRWRLYDVRGYANGPASAPMRLLADRLLRRANEGIEGVEGDAPDGDAGYAAPNPGDFYDDDLPF
jgi:hypothetical protein